MTDAAYPVTYAALLDVATDTLACRTTDGWDISEDPSDVLMLGVPNLTDSAAIAAGSFEQEQITHGAGGLITETGTINGIVMCWNGESTDAGAQAARTSAFGYIAALNAAIRADRKLGVTDFDLWVGTAIASGSVAEDKVDGATCAVSFTVNYKAQI